MITELEINNFKCFVNLRLSFRSLTLLTGFNGGGKSSALQPLLLLSQGVTSSSRADTYALNGPRVRLGTVADVLPADTDKSVVSFEVSSPASRVSWKLSARAGDRLLAVLGVERHLSPDRNGKSLPSSSTADKSEVEQSLAGLTFLSAVREGTADAFPIPDLAVERAGDVGVDGRFAPYLYDRIVDEEVLPARRHPAEAANSTRKQLDAWLATLFPDAQANVQAVPQLCMLSLQFRLSGIGAWRRPANVGYGLTYVFPILVALLAAGKNEIVVIDSPEAHLHPYAQSKMGWLLAHFANAGVQIVVETHSDHLLNGVRLAVKEKVIPARDLQIHFFTGADKEGHGVISPPIDIEGRIEEWPAGFFDQAEKDLSQLAGWE